jgi:hypothetical protein
LLPLEKPSAGGDTTLEVGKLRIIVFRNDLLGPITTTSQAVINNQEIQTHPDLSSRSDFGNGTSLTVTSHSGEGKPNQYLLRGYNLDHDTDLETYVDGMPINQPTHAHGPHGQGYTALNL